MAGKDVAIPIVFPDYLIAVDTPPVKLDIPDWVPGLPKRVVIPKTHNKLPYLGHAGILFISGANGLTKYYEYGRYDPAAYGLVRKTSIPDVKLSGGRPTARSLSATLAAVSQKSGQSTRIMGAYIELDPGAFAKMLAYAEKRYALNKTPSRPKYDLTENSCMHFMRSTTIAGGVTMPDVFDPRPVGYMDKVRESYPDLDFTRPSTLTIQGITLP